MNNLVNKIASRGIAAIRITIEKVNIEEFGLFTNMMVEN